MPGLSWIASNVLLALLLAMAAWLLQHSQRWRGVAHILWVLALVKLVTPPLVRVPLLTSPSEIACMLGTCGCDHHTELQTIASDRLPWIFLGMWTAGATATAWLAWCRSTRLRRLLAYARPAPAEWQTLAAHLCSELSIRLPPEVLTVPGRLPPLVVPGRPRPRMLLPMGMLDQLNTSQRAALLLHELAHLKRGDHLVRVLELVVGILYWWLPFVGWIGRQLRSCEEACCDNAVIAHLPDARREYARLLLDVVDFVNPLPEPAIQQATAMGARDLERRMRTILDGSQHTQRAWLAGALALGLGCAIMPCELYCGLVSKPTTSSAESEQCDRPAPLPIVDPDPKSISCGCPS